MDGLGEWHWNMNIIICETDHQSRFDARDRVLTAGALGWPRGMGWGGMWEARVKSLGWKDPLEKEMATHSSTHAWKIPWMEKPGGLQSMGSERVGHDWVTSLHILYWCFSFWLTSLCIIGSSFIHLIRTGSNVFFLMAEWYSIVYIYHSFPIHSSADGYLLPSVS